MNRSGWNRIGGPCLGILVAVLASAPGLADEAASSGRFAGPPLVVFPPPSAEELAGITARDLRDELLRLASDDQRVRAAGGCGSDPENAAALASEIEAVDRRNTARFEAIVQEHGWPTATMVGPDGASAAWLLAQHADSDPDFQQECLALMTPHSETGEASPIDLAYLFDRVRVNAGRPQLYGTQFQDVDGKRVPRPIEAPEQVDERRAGLGMRTLRAYSKFVNT